jgi:hypothetical protein
MKMNLGKNGVHRFRGVHKIGFPPAIYYIAITPMIQEFETTKNAEIIAKTCPKEKK